MIAKSLGALAVFTAVLPAAAAAQSAPPPAAYAHRFGGPDRAARFQEHEARRLKALHDLLQIRPDQEAAFQSFATALRPEPPAGAPMATPPARQDMASLTTPERLDRMAKMMADHEARQRARFDRVSAAVKTFYASLSPEQRRAFDALPALGFGLGGHMDDGEHKWAGGMNHHGGPPMGPPPPPPGA